MESTVTSLAKHAIDNIKHHHSTPTNEASKIKSALALKADKLKKWNVFIGETDHWALVSNQF